MDDSRRIESGRAGRDDDGCWCQKGRGQILREQEQRGDDEGLALGAGPGLGLLASWSSMAFRGLGIVRFLFLLLASSSAGSLMPPVRWLGMRITGVGARPLSRVGLGWVGSALGLLVPF